MIDVGFDRLGDALGGGAIRVILWSLPAAANSVLLGLAAILGAAGYGLHAV